MWLYKLYTWSVVFEPLFFFSGLESVAGVGVSLARVLQLAVVLCYSVSFAIKPSPVSNDLFFRRQLTSLKNHYWIFLLVALAGSSFVFLLNVLDNNPIFKIVSWHKETTLLRSAYIRPFFEVVIYIYYFWYFVILPHKFFKSIAQLRYFFKAFSLVFVANLALGYVDVIGGRFFHIYDMIPRHLIETLQGSWISCGGRFHGFCGEPRDAFVYLVLGIAVYLLTAVMLKRKANVFYISTILFAILLTASASGLIGLVLFVLLLSVINIFYRCIKVRYSIALVILVCLMVGVGVYTNKHVVTHLENVQLLFKNWHSGNFYENLYIGEGLMGQLGNIFPILHLLGNIKSFNLLPVIFGHGIGTHVMVNNFAASNIGISSGHLYNSATMIVRIVYEFGVLGLFLFVLSMVRPLILLSNKIRDLQIHTKLVVISMLAVLAAGLAQRHAAPFIFLGIAHVSLLRLRNNDSSQNSLQTRSVKGGC